MKKEFTIEEIRDFFTKKLSQLEGETIILNATMPKVSEHLPLAEAMNIMYDRAVKKGINVGKYMLLNEMLDFFQAPK